MKSKPPFAFLFFCALFFLSGACGLTYEMIWARKLGLIFGNTTLAVSTVLAAFMAGLGLGSVFFGYYVDRKGSPLYWYAILEIGIGIFCLLTPFFWRGVESFYVWAYQSFHFGFWPLSVLRFFICFVLLFIPTFFMGGTLPVLTKFFVRDSRETARGLGFLYGINTLGAVAGVIFSSFFAIYFFGLHGTVVIVAAVNILIGMSAIFFVRTADFLDRKRGVMAGEQEPAGASRNIVHTAPGLEGDPLLIKILLAGFALSGFASMAYQVCWTRVLALALGGSIYSFAVMLASFLTGLSIGSVITGMFARRVKLDHGTFAVAQIFIAFFALWGLNLFDQMPLYFLQLFSEYGKNNTQFHIAKFFLASIVILPPTIFMGATLAIVAQVINRSAATTGRTVGNAYFINTVGCIAGSIAVGFVLIPAIGIYKTFLLVIAINLFIGFFIFFFLAKEPRVFRTMMVVVLMLLMSILLAQTKPWSKGLLTTNIAIDPKMYLGHSKYEIYDSTQQGEMLYYKEGLAGVVSVKKNHDSMALAINANVDASSGIDMQTQLMLGHLPTLLVADPKRALVIGMGSGVTLGALSTYPYERFDCVELEAAVVEAAKLFSNENRNVLNDPRLKNFINDGRNHLLAENLNYDVIISEPSSPWMAGVASLFTLEQFELIKKRLAPGGVACQWLNTYSMSPQNIQMIISTFRRAFKYTSLWQAIGVDLLLIGSDHELTFDVRAINEKIQKNPELRRDLMSMKVNGASGILASFLLTHDELAQLSRDDLLNNDNFPYLEYLVPLNLYGFENTVSQNFQMILSFRRARYPKIINGPQTADEKAKFHNAIARAFLHAGNVPEAGVEIGLSNKEEALNIGSILMYGVMESISGNADKAISDLSYYLTADPENADAHFYMGKAYIMKQAMDAALVHYKAAVASDRSDYWKMVECGEVFLQAGLAKDAIGVLEKAIGLKGLNLKNGIVLIRALSLDGDREKAIKVLGLLKQKYPHFFAVYQAAVDLYEQDGQHDKALAACLEARQMTPFAKDNYYLMAQLYKKKGDEKNARRMMKIYSFYQNAPKIGIRNF